MSATKKVKKTNVFWKPDEYAKVAAWMIANGHTDLKKRGILAIIDAAQRATLDHSRYRTVSATTAFLPLGPAMVEAQAAHDALKADMEKRAAEEKRRHQEQEAAQQRAAEEEKERKAMEEAHAALVPQHPLDAIFQALARECIQRFVHHVRIEAQQAMAREFGQMMTSIVPGSADAVAKLAPRQRVLVVGLKPNQAGMIAQEHQDLDLRFVESGTTPQAIKGKLNGVDTVIGITDFIGHDQEDVMKGHPGYVRVGGGMTKLRNVLTAMRARMG